MSLEHLRQRVVGRGVVVLLVHGGGCFAGADSASDQAGFGNGAGDDNEVETAGNGDPNGGSGGGGEEGSPGPTPEDEVEADFRVPRASGAFVYSASEVTDSVAVIDSETLTIDVVGVGRGPTVIAPIAAADAQAGAVAVLDQRGNDVAILRTAALGGTTVELFDVTPGANNLVTSPDGRFALVHVDVDGPEQLGPGSDQELTILDVVEGEVHVMTVGAHPRAIEFSTDSQYAYIVTADGVNVVDLAVVGEQGKPDIIPTYIDAGVDPTRLEVLVAAEHGIALARVEGESVVVATDLLTREQQVFELDGIPTDLDLSPTGDYALLTLPSVTDGSRLFELPLPLGDAPQLTESRIEVEYLGLAQLAPDGATGVFYTTQNPSRIPTPSPGDTGGTETGEGSSTGGEPDATGLPDDVDPRLRVTLARRSEAGWASLVTLFVDRPVESVGVAPDGANAILLHQAAPEQPVPFAYTLVDLTKEFPVKKTQTVDAPPVPFMFTPDGSQAVVLLRLDTSAVRRVERIDLRTFIVEGLELGSPPEGVGYVDTTQKVFVSQDHPIGRITFIDPRGDIETVTGYRLNDAVKD